MIFRRLWWPLPTLPAMSSHFAQSKINLGILSLICLNYSTNKYLGYDWNETLCTFEKINVFWRWFLNQKLLAVVCFSTSLSVCNHFWISLLGIKWTPIEISYIVHLPNTQNIFLVLITAIFLILSPLVKALKLTKIKIKINI